MDHDNLKQIFDHYIEKFEYLNNDQHRETYKWKIAYRFKPMMDAALAASEQDFPAALYQVKKLTENLIDSYTQPFGGLCKFAEIYPERVRQMFLALFAEDHGDVGEKQRKILAFLDSSHALRDELAPGSYLYNDDYHSVSAYLFLYDPDNNYLYKASHAREFADCIEFYDEWGSGMDIRLDVFYRMCEAVVSAVKEYQPLVLTDESRFKEKDGKPRTDLFADRNKHLLVFDLLYCCSTYQLFDGITYNHRDSKERLLWQERREKALEWKAVFEEARAAEEKLTEATAYLQSYFQPGTVVRHRSFQEGTVVENNGAFITVAFAAGVKKMDPAPVVCSRYLTTDQLGKDGRLEEYLPVLKQKEHIKHARESAEKMFAQYAEYLD